MRQGHRLVLYCYEAPEGVPEGIELADAGNVLPADRIIRYRSGSHALFANLFRYELQRQGRGTWVDCDLYLLKPLEGEKPYLIGEEEPGTLNNAVLRIPADSTLLPALIEPFGGRSVPWWMPWRAQMLARLRLVTTGRAGVDRMPWGTTGPKALTALARRLEAPLDPASPEVFYPVHWQDAAWIVDPTQQLEDKIGPRTVSLHLWNERIKHLKEQPAPAGSFLARLREEGR